MTRSHRLWGWFLNFGNFGDYGNSSCLHGRCCFSDYGAYVRFRATCPACPGVAVGPCRGSRAIFFPPLTPLTPCFKGAGLGFPILAIPAIMAILAIASFALTCPGLPWIRS